MKRTLVLVLAATVLLSGCGKTLTIQDRTDYREECEASDGTYHEGPNGWDGEIIMWCDLERKEN